MPGKVLIIEDIVTSRIVLNVKFSAAGYHVTQTATLDEARVKLPKAQPDFILFACRQPEAQAHAAVASLSTESRAEIVVLTQSNTLDTRLSLLKAGAAEVMNTPPNIPALLARFRALKRARDSLADTHLEQQISHALGFCEAQESFTRHAPATLLFTCSAQKSSARAAALGNAARCRPAVLSAPDVLSTFTEGQAPPDVILLELDENAVQSGKLNLLSEIKSSAATRRCALLVLLPDDAGLAHAEAFDRGADEVLPSSCDPKELRLRLRRISARKRRLDGRRASMEAGLNAAITDPLTGLFNRRFAEPELDRLITRSSAPCAILALDIDHFKTVNDRFGHAAGDAVLLELAQILRASLRPGDLAARLGGEEFLLALPNTAPARATRIAQRLRQVIAEHDFVLDASSVPLKITVSIGLAVSRETQKDTRSLLEEADSALYGSKRCGRNQVTVSERSAA